MTVQVVTEITGYRTYMVEISDGEFTQDGHAIRTKGEEVQAQELLGAIISDDTCIETVYDDEEVMEWAEIKK